MWYFDTNVKNEPVKKKNRQLKLANKVNTRFYTIISTTFLTFFGPNSHYNIDQKISNSFAPIILCKDLIKKTWEKAFYRKGDKKSFLLCFMALFFDKKKVAATIQTFSKK